MLISQHKGQNLKTPTDMPSTLLTVLGIVECAYAYRLLITATFCYICTYRKPCYSGHIMIIITKGS